MNLAPCAHPERFPRALPIPAPLVVVAVALSVVLGLAGPARANVSQLTILQDDGALLGSAARQQRSLDQVSALGADTIHSLVSWRSLSPSPAARRRPSVDLSDPASYSGWDHYDGLVRGAQARGLNLILSPASPIPRWASHCAGDSARLLRTCRPDPALFAQFVAALGRRYSGSYAPPGATGSPLPRVARWSIWNEPNQPGWLSPQFTGHGAHPVPTSPVLYRSLVLAGIGALHSTGHGSDQILLGETAPLGRRLGGPVGRSMDPGTFYRVLLCVDPRGRTLGGRAGRALGCTHPRRLAVTGVAHHPYTRGGSQPPTARSSSQEITISSIGRLQRILDQAAGRGRLPRSLPIYYTEFGFQTNPPDRLFGLPLTRQATYLDESAWIAYNNPRIASVAQYELFDDTGRASSRPGCASPTADPSRRWPRFHCPSGWYGRAVRSRCSASYGRPGCVAPRCRSKARRPAPARSSPSTRQPHRSAGISAGDAALSSRTLAPARAPLRRHGRPGEPGGPDRAAVTGEEEIRPG